jgi:flagellar hook-basal body complex protein FliE
MLRGVTNPALEKLAQGVMPTGAPSSKPAKTDDDFAQMLMDVMKEVNDSQNKATQVQNDFMTGRREVDYHDLMIAMERASTTMNLTLAVRNKLLEAYQEISRMQV